MSNVNARILLWGIEGSGKTTTLETIHAKLRPDLRGDLRSEPTRLDPGLTYETLPISLGEIGGVGMQLELVAVPGAPDQTMTRKQLLDEIDGVVLVLDCSPEKIHDNLAMISELRDSLEAYGRSLDTVPIVLQYNKRDIADPFAIEELHRSIGLQQAAVFETIATTGHGVLPTLTTISKNVVRARKGGTGPGIARSPAPSAPLDSAAAPAAAAPSIAPTTLPDAEPELLEIDVEPGEPGTEAGPQDILEAAILAEGDDERDPFLSMSEAMDLDRMPSSDPDWRVDDRDASKPEAALGAHLRIVSVGQATLASDGGVQLPLVLGDESGQSRSVVLSLRLDALIGNGSD